MDNKQAQEKEFDSGVDNMRVIVLWIGAFIVFVLVIIPLVSFCIYNVTFRKRHKKEKGVC